VADTPLSFVARFMFAWVCFFRILFDGVFARDISNVQERGRLPATRQPTPSMPAIFPPPPADSALLLLAVLQREGRLVDFLEQDVSSFSDADIGAAARVVHDGCRRALRAHARIAPIRREDEGTRITISAGFLPAEVKLSGNVGGSAPFTGVLRHRGWRALSLDLPVPVTGHDANVLAPAEIEL
jgi:hypothetical protein